MLRAKFLESLGLDSGLAPVLLCTCEASGGWALCRRAERRLASMMGQGGEERNKGSRAQRLVNNQLVTVPERKKTISRLRISTRSALKKRRNRC